MALKEYSLILTQAPSGGWTIRDNSVAYGGDHLIAAYSNKRHMLNGLLKLIDEREKSDGSP